MNLSTLRPPTGAVKKRKRVGRGNGSGHGGTAGKGSKGQKARSGGSVRTSFEGGQMPLARRLPKRGFRNLFRKEFSVVNIGQLDRFPQGTLVDEDAILKSGLVKKRRDGIKILGKGSLGHPLTVKISNISAAAREKITAAGGSIS